ncbi:MAG: thioredoxin domain-containing protein [bacterium]
MRSPDAQAPDSPVSPTTGNRLSAETSPYLLDHARNPVDWHPWGPEAWSRARAEDKPIFLSIGYSACHWCHVMARESFSDPETAAILNEHFVCIKVDREERPDIDDVYVEAVRVLTGSAGWPLSVFLTADLKPFYGGTYFPPEPRHGLPGFKRVLLSVSHYYRAERAAIDRAAGAVVAKLDELSRPEPNANDPSADLLERYYRQRREAFDSEHGGFGVAPRFPSPTDLELLLRLASRPGFEDAASMAELTLGKMAEGGIWDQLGGGFHRYSTDTLWLVPHFEKMLYDQALLARAYYAAFSATGNESWRAIGEEALDWLERELRADGGAYCSALDADAAGAEGAYYVWSKDEFEDALGPGLAPLAADLYGVTEEGNFAGRNVLHVAQPVDTLLRTHGLGPDELWPRLEQVKARLLAARGRRPAPRRDNKVLADWNGLVLSALARAHQATGTVRFLDRAQALAGFIRERLLRGADVIHRERAGFEPVPGQLADYALVGRGLLDLFQSDFDPACLRLAGALTDRAVKRFRAPAGGLYSQDPATPGLISATVSGVDSPVPAGTAVIAGNLLDLARLTGRDDLRETALGILRRFNPVMRRWPTAFATMLAALDRHLRPGLDVALFIPDAADETAFLAALRRQPDPDRLVVLVRSAEAPAELAELVPLVRGRGALGGRPTAWTCAGGTCRPPVHDPDELAAVLAAGASLDSTDGPPRL